MLQVFLTRQTTTPADRTCAAISGVWLFLGGAVLAGAACSPALAGDWRLVGEDRGRIVGVDLASRTNVAGGGIRARTISMSSGMPGSGPIGYSIMTETFDCGRRVISGVDLEVHASDGSVLFARPMHYTPFVVEAGGHREVLLAEVCRESSGPDGPSYNTPLGFYQAHVLAPERSWAEGDWRATGGGSGQVIGLDFTSIIIGSNGLRRARMIMASTGLWGSDEYTTAVADFDCENRSVEAFEIAVFRPDGTIERTSALHSGSFDIELGGYFFQALEAACSGSPSTGSVGYGSPLAFYRSVQGLGTDSP